MVAKKDDGFDFVAHAQRKDMEAMVDRTEIRLRNEWKDAELRLNATCARIEGKIDDGIDRLDGRINRIEDKLDEHIRETKKGFERIEEKFDGKIGGLEDKFVKSRNRSIGLMVTMLATMIVGFGVVIATVIS